MTEFTRCGSPDERGKPLLSVHTTHAAAHGMSNGNGIGSTFAFEWHGGALVATIRGVILLDDTRLFRQALAAELGRRYAVKVLIDIRDAMLMIGEASQGRMTAEAVAMPIEAPVGYIATSTQWQVMFSHCMGVAATGRLRIMFSDVPRAARWIEVPVERLLTPKAQAVAPLAPSR